LTVADFLKLPPAQRLRPVVVLAGDEAFFKDEALAAIVAAQAEGTERVDRRLPSGRGTPDLSDLLDELRTGSLFSAAKLVVVRDAETLLANAGEAVLAHAKRSGTRIALVLDVATIDKRTKAGKELEKAATVVECKRLYADPPPWAKGGPPWDTPLVQWTVARARAAGLAARPDVAHHLTQITGNDLYEISATLDKIGLSGSKELTPEHIEALAGRTRRDDAFAVADGFGKRDIGKVLEVLSRVFERGLEDRKGGTITDGGAVGLIVFGRIYSKLGEIRRTLAYLEGGGQRSRDAVAAALGIAPFLADRALADAERWRGMDLRAAWRALLEADLAIKGAVPAGGPRAAIERLAACLLKRSGSTAKMPAQGGRTER
jgi:DNA polymerase III delta subunit